MTGGGVRSRAIVACVVAASLAGGLAPREAVACAGCRNPNLPVTRLGSSALGAREVRATVAATATSVHVVHEAGCRDAAACAEVPAQPLFLHDQRLYPLELRLMAELGLTNAFGLEAHLPVRAIRTSIAYTTPEGAPYQPLDPDIHHRNETVGGVADPWLMVRLSTMAGGWWLAARGGATLPLGRTEEDPFALGDRGQRHQHIQLGNGTIDPLMALDAGRSWGRLSLNGYAQAQLTLYENARGFRAGHRFLGGVQGGGRVVESLTALLGVDLLTDRPERWQGVVRQDGNLGRTELLLGLSLIRPIGATTVSLGVRIPVYRHLITGAEGPGRLSSPVIVSVTLGRTFLGR